ncbi:MAG TPA: chemotaxis protein CheB [Actinophytocola sp.]|jgi:two-component system chemotaxis response regulator CheB|nr:chemotaxis protein CheB [Actinophytocola sp.]
MRDLIVVGASAGGVEALRDLAAGLPPDLPASVLVVLHLPAGGRSVLPAILERAGPLPARTARDATRPAHGSINVAPPDQHLLVVGARMVLSAGPPEHGRRPAIDALFRSAALAAGARVIGVLLSGVLDDGVAGLKTIARHGGTVMVQDPAEALYPNMPTNAIDALTVDHVLRAGDMGPVLAQLSRQEIDSAGRDDMLAAADRGQPEERP